MVVTIVVGLALFCASGTAIALVLCGAARNTKRPEPTHANVEAEDRAPVAQAQ